MYLDYQSQSHSNHSQNEDHELASGVANMTTSQIRTALYSLGVKIINYFTYFVFNKYSISIVYSFRWLFKRGISSKISCCTKSFLK